MKRALSLCVAALVAVAIVGCAEEEPGPSSGLAFVIGARANSPQVPVETLMRHIDDDLTEGSMVSVTGIDGAVDGVELAREVVGDESTSYDKENAALDRNAKISKSFKNAAAIEPEADVLGAISAGARSISSVEGTKTMVIADSMLSTAGHLQFQAGLLATSPEDVVESLVGLDALPALDGIHIVIISQGNTVGTQEALRDHERRQLRSLWEAVLMASGAADVTYDDSASTAEQEADLPSVSTVDLAPIIVDAVPCTAVFTEYLVGFVPNEPDFLDDELARATIQSAADQLGSCVGQIRVIGTTSSWGTEESREDTSTKRAQAVAAVLAESLGDNASTFIVDGVGMNFPEYVNDRDGGGNLIPVEAAKNRSVRISVGDS